MKLRFILSAAGLLSALATPAMAATMWNAWSVGSAAPVVSGTSVQFMVGQEATPVWTGGALGSKDFYSTSAFNGQSLGSLAGASLSYTITAPGPLVSPPGNGLQGPYVNIVVTDGAGGYSYLLMDASPAPLGQQFHAFSTARYAFNETSPSLDTFVTALGTPDAIFGDKNWYDFSDVASLTIASSGMSSNPSGVTPVAGVWTGYGLTDSLLFVSGNRGSSPAADVTIDGVTFVPEPASLAIMALGLAGIGLSRRKAAVKSAA